MFASNSCNDRSYNEPLFDRDGAVVSGAFVDAEYSSSLDSAVDAGQCEVSISTWYQNQSPPILLVNNGRSYQKESHEVDHSIVFIHLELCISCPSLDRRRTTSRVIGPVILQ